MGFAKFNFFSRFFSGFLSPGVLALVLAGFFWPATAATDAAQRLQEEARRKNLARHPTWHRLLHYERRLWGGYKSEVDAREFFLARRGKTRPEAELDATLQSFFDSPPEDPETLHPQCRFPARYAWLKSQLAFEPGHPPEQACERFRGWRGRLNARTVTFVFASSYMNNPASMYGHTFLRLDPGEGQGAALNSYSVNFAADTPARNGLVFAVRGLVGGYPGRFTTVPYYMKVQQYSNMESRDLWEYKLNLGTAQVEALVAHLWEMGSAHFRYFFLTENCSYQLLPLLEAADSSLRLADRFRFKVIPSDTVRALRKEPGLVAGVRRRPSLMQEILARRARLSAEELRAAEQVAGGQGTPPFAAVEALPRERQALVLDSAYDYFRFRHNFSRFPPPDVEEYERQILLRRGQTAAGPSQDTSLRGTGESPPEAGHKTGRVGLGAGDGRHGVFQDLSLRGALHDLVADPTGYVQDSQLEMFHLVLRRRRQENQAYVEKFTLMDIVSLAPWERWVRRLSWNFFMGFETVKEAPVPPERALAFHLAGGAGGALKSRVVFPALVYALAEAEGGVGGVFQDNYRAGVGGSAGLILSPVPVWRLHVVGRYRRYPAGDVRSSTAAEFTQAVRLAKDWELRSTLRRRGLAREGLVSLNLYL